MRQPRQFYKGGFWHIFNRGVAKENIFREKDDFIFYLYKIKESLKRYPIIINAYNLLAKLRKAATLKDSLGSMTSRR